MSYTELRSELRTAKNSEDANLALSKFLKSEKTSKGSSSELYKDVKSFENKCGPGVDAEECKAIIDQCIMGDAKEQSKCRTVLEEIVKSTSRQKILADGIRGMDGRIARSVCKTLALDYEVPNAVDQWVKGLMKSDPSAAIQIKDNQPIIEIIKSKKMGRTELLSIGKVEILNYKFT